MVSLFKTNLKQKLKSSAIWMLIIVMIILSYSYLKRGFERSELNAIVMDCSTVAFDKEYFSKPISEYFCNSYEEYIEENPMIDMSESYYNIEVDVHEKSERAFREENQKEKNRLNSFSNLLSTNFLVQSHNTKDALFVYEICRKANEELWDKISGGTKYEDIDFENTNGTASNLAELIADVTTMLFNARFFYYLYSHDLKYILPGEFTNLEGIYGYLINFFPIILIVVCILLNYDSINKEVTGGSVKLILTQSTPRWKYYLSRYFTGVIITLFVVLLPMLITNLYLGFQIGFESIDYPVLYDGQGVKKFKPAFNYMELMESKIDITFWDYASFIKKPYRKNFEVSNLYQRNIDIIPFYKFILLSFLFTLLFIMFLVAFVQLFSALINNKVLSLMTITGIFAANYYIFKPFLYEEHYNLCPFTMNNSARIVAGTHNVTMLTAFIVLTLSTVIFLLIGVKYFNEKEI